MAMRSWLETRAQPDRVLASAATRTTATAEGLFPGIAIESVAELYLCHVRTLMDRIETATLEYDEVAIVGHNPTIAQGITELAQEPLETSYPTLSVARFEVEIEPTWSYRLTDFVTPKILRGS